MIGKGETKRELINTITMKTQIIPARFQPSVKRSFLKGLLRKSRSELIQIANKMRVEYDHNGYDIYTN